MLVFGACENHGDHIPFGSDFIVPIELAKRISKRMENAIVFGLYHMELDYTMQNLT